MCEQENPAPAQMAFQQALRLVLIELERLDQSGVGQGTASLRDCLNRWVRGLPRRLRQHEAAWTRKLTRSMTPAEAAFEARIGEAAVGAAETCLRRATICTREVLRNKYLPLVYYSRRISLRHLLKHQVEQALIDLAADWDVPLIPSRSTTRTSMLNRYRLQAVGQIGIEPRKAMG